MRIVHVVGARPNFIKAAPVIKEMARYPEAFEQTLVHTGQHYDGNMSEVFFDELELPRPNINLEVGSGSHAQQTALIMQRFEPVLLEYRPDWVVVPGDVNSTLACAVVAAKLGIKVAHVEAGLRSFDRTMPEEINRVLTDHVADLLFTTEASANQNLAREGIPTDKIYFVGNTMIDTLVKLYPKAQARWASLQSHLGVKSYVLVTLHRPSNVDNPAVLSEITKALIVISRKIPVVFPVHPRSKGNMAKFGLLGGQCDSSNLKIIDPLGYLDFLALQANARLVVTDSGGIQEETTYLGIPCLTVRPNTERPVTITDGTNQLVRQSSNDLINAVHSVLTDVAFTGHRVRRGEPPLWDGKAATRIVAVFLEKNK